MIFFDVQILQTKIRNIKDVTIKQHGAILYLQHIATWSVKQYFKTSVTENKSSINLIRVNIQMPRIACDTSI